MKILHIEAGRYLYGGAQQVVWLTRGLALRGVENVLVCPNGSEIAGAAADTVRVRMATMNGDLDFRLVSRLTKIIREEKPDLIHIHSRRGADVFGGIAASWMGVPCVLSRRVDNREPRWSVPLKYRLYDKVIVISEAIGRVLRACGVPAEKVTSVRSAVDAAFYDCPADKGWFQGEFKLPSDEMTLGVIAQLIPRKGHRYLLDVLPDLLRRFPRLNVLIFGQGPLSEALEARVASAEFGGRVKMVGFRDDLRRVLPNLYAIVHPAEREGLGVALLQASASSVPVIAARAGGIPEIVRDGNNGLTFDVGDRVALKTHLEQILLDSRLRDQLGEGGRSLADNEFSIEAMVDGNYQVYQELLRR
ncbi:glycosyltransferase [Luminiphilus sp.]|nr:glycosyltransferase [Luminiphilus sp.]